MKLILKPDAEDDIDEAARWYEDQRKNIGTEFLNELGEVLNRIKSNPFLFQKKYRNVHIAFLRRFPFGIYFAVEQQQVFVIAVLHTSRNPLIWKKRSIR